MKDITVIVGPISLTLPCGDNQALQYAQSEDMLEMVMKQFREEFTAPVPTGMDEILN